jgi:hypothetical protein
LPLQDDELDLQIVEIEIINKTLVVRKKTLVAYQLKEDDVL